MPKLFVSILSGLGAMFGWGTSDFLASSVSIKVGNIKAFFWAQLSGLFLMLTVLASILPRFDIAVQFWPLLLLSVAGYLIGYLYYYKSFEIGNLSVVAVVINLNAIFTMLVAYFVRGQRLTGLQLPAVALVIIGIILVSVNFDDLFKNKSVRLLAGVKEAIIASVGFGILCWPITDYLVEQVNWLWETITVRFLAIVFIISVSFFKKQNLSMPKNIKNIWRTVIISGILEATAVLSLNYGFTVGDSILIAPIANSVAVVTVILAIIFLKEKITRMQLAGIILTIGGIVLTAF
jgi:drug/metabolite transporter (DMT)-like permease